MDHGLEVEFWLRALRRHAVAREVAVPVAAVRRDGSGAESLVPLAAGGAWPDPAAAVAALVGEAEVGWDSPRLAADLDGEALVLVDGEVRGALNAMHRFVDLDVLRGVHRLRLEVLPTGLMGVRHRPPRVRALAFQAVDRALEAIAYDLEALSEWARLESVPATARERAWEGIHAALEPLRALPPDLESWRAWLACEAPDETAEQLRATLLHGEGQAPPLAAVPEGELRNAMAEAGRRLRALYAELAQGYPRGVGGAILMGHAHIDTAWLWPIRVGHQKAVRTFATQAALLRDHPEARFGASAPEHYAAVERAAPELFGRVAGLVRDGRFLPLGAFWVECDANLPGAESIARHLIYGLRYFMDRFGARPEVAFLPDSFGFSPALPSLLAAAGVRLFCTTKLNWNDTTRFPYVDFTWVGPDGASVQAHVFGQGHDGYNGAADLRDIVDTVSGYAARGGRRRVLYTYGHGDGGGGPTAEMLERLRRYRELPLLPAMEHGGPEALLAPAAARPLYRGPLYLEYHRGTYTSQSWAKHLARRAEEALSASEAVDAWASQGGAPSPADDWRSLLRGQFHDILPGSSIHEVYVDLEREWRALLARAEDRLARAAGRLAGTGEQALVVVNRSSLRAPAQTCLVERALQAASTDGRPLRVQRAGAGTIVEVPPLEPFGVAVLAVREGAGDGPVGEGSPAAAASGTVALAHGRLRLEVAAEGITALWHGGERLTAGQVIAYRQHPERYDAWELVPPADRAPVALAHAAPSVEDGPLRATVHLRHTTPGGTEILEDITLDRVLGHVEVGLRVRAAERRLVIAYELRTSLDAEHATAGGMIGTERHPAVPGGPADSARYEWPAHAWVDVSEPTLGLAVLNDGRYGHAFADRTLSVTLVTTPLYPDPLADREAAPARLALVAHDGDWRRADIDARAHAFSAGLATRLGAFSQPHAPAPILGLPSGMRLLAFKGAEDGSSDIVAHLLEGRGERGEARLAYGLPIEDAWQVDLVEERRLDPPGAAVRYEASDGTVALRYRPYALIALRVRPRRPSDAAGHAAG